MKKLLLLSLILQSLCAFGKTGILFIAHGTAMDHGDHLSNSCTPHHWPKWEGYVLTTLKSIDNDIKAPYEVAFGMWESHCFDEGIKRLEQKMQHAGDTLDHLIVFPLFISSHSEVMEMQKFIFKKRSDQVIPLPQVRPTYFEGKITYMNALDYDPQVSMILAKRFQDLIKQAINKGYTQKNMELILVMHGPVDDEANIEWMKMGKKYVQDLTYLFPVHNSHVISLRDDAAPEVKDEVTLLLRSLVQEAKNKGRIALVVPLLISSGGIEAGVVKRLKDLDYFWTGEALLPDSKLADVILRKLDLVLTK